ncbi:MAG TPA: peptidylprolyl isomerase [Steroidobacteraceae bacterium]|nr:peptidylprolyl isomerase [Steroidobacteraceae bacterium]
MREPRSFAAAVAQPSFSVSRLVSLALLLTLCALLGLSAVHAEEPSARRPLTGAQVLAASQPSEWAPLDPQNTIYFELPAGRVVIALAPGFASRYVTNIKLLVRQGFFDGTPILRVQDDYVTQWGDASSPERPLGAAQRTLPAEFMVSAREVPFTALPDPDTYAPEVGFSEGFPAARDPKIGRAWLVHCYGMVGAGRDVDVDSGNGSELYAVIGQAPRQLDRNIALVGRVVQGMELLAALPRGKGELGFYDKQQPRPIIRAAHVAADVPVEQRTALEVLRTDSRSFAEWVESRRNRRDPWFKVPAGRIDVCNIPIPVRAARPTAQSEGATSSAH